AVLRGARDDDQIAAAADRRHEVERRAADCLPARVRALTGAGLARDGESGALGQGFEEALRGLGRTLRSLVVRYRPDSALVHRPEIRQIPVTGLDRPGAKVAPDHVGAKPCRELEC